ncbi:MAG TPA: PTS sugar transporter subunit IIC, partial [Candidatus Olsenella avicola]|nr:PTS sugar transporter subunit IIC [Candidatus Olsenella avicola]
MIQALLLAIWAGLCTWDQFGPHLGFRKPLLASVGVGIIL